MNKEKVIKETTKYVQARLQKNGGSHDWWHVERVLKNSLAIASKEKNADIFVVKLGALLHDVADFKFNDGDETLGGKVAQEWLKQSGVDEQTISQVIHIVDNVSFKGLGVDSKMTSLEGKIVQDGDRLDAMGAIGIGRTFAYGGHVGRLLYDPHGKAKKHKNFEEYKKESDSTVHHFYEKTLHLKDLMNTKTGKKLAQARHKFLLGYLKEFYAEWGGIR